MEKNSTSSAATVVNSNNGTDYRYRLYRFRSLLGDVDRGQFARIRVFLNITQSRTTRRSVYLRRRFAQSDVKLTAKLRPNYIRYDGVVHRSHLPAVDQRRGLEVCRLLTYLRTLIRRFRAGTNNFLVVRLYVLIGSRIILWAVSLETICFSGRPLPCCLIIEISVKGKKVKLAHLI